MIDFNKLLKSSAGEVGSFAKKNAAKFGVIGDLQKARDGCKTKEARAMIEGLILPLQKELKKECAGFEARMSKIWKLGKGEEMPPETQKKLDGVMQKASREISAKSGKKTRHNSDPGHASWIVVEAFE